MSDARESRVDTFSRAVGIFFAFVILALAIATFANVPLSYYGAFFFFHVLDTHQFVVERGRLIDIPLELPMLAASRFTDNLGVLRAIFCAAYAAIPALGLAASWLVCRSRRPSLFIWPAMSICIIGLPGQFSLHSEAIMAATLLWPALLAVLVGAPATVWPLVAITSIAAAGSHPNAAAVLAFIILVAIVSAIMRTESRKVSLPLALALTALLLARIFRRLDPYESERLSVLSVVRSLHDSVIGWPLVAVALAMVAALCCLLCARPRARLYLMTPLILAGVALVAWAIHPASWAKCNDFRFWVAPLSMLFMSGATVEELWLRRPPEPQLQELRRYAVPLIGAIFFLVLSIQSLQWGLISRRLTNDLVSSDRGCVSRANVTSIRHTALDQWQLGFYALELQGRTPRTLLLEHRFACRLFGQNGDAIFVDNGNYTYIRHRGEGWFDFEDARSRAGAARK
jgi:hypothetical protein